MKTLMYYSGPAQEKLDDADAFRKYMDEKQRQRKLARNQRRNVGKKPQPMQTSRPKAKYANKPRRRAAATPATIWLNSLICPWVYGEKTPVGVRPSIEIEKFVQRWNQKTGLRQIANYRLLDHFGGDGTLYFFGQGYKKAKRSLAMIDIDVLKSKGLGSPEGATKFAEHLKHIWPNLYFEVSTNGKGIHCYVIIYKFQSEAFEVNKALKRLEKWLRVEAKRVNADIELVEVKGTCMDMTFEYGKLQAVKYGMFAKLPRDVSRFSEWQKTTELRVVDLYGKRFDVDQQAATMTTPVPKPGIVKQCHSSGSVSGKIISEEELASIPQFERLYGEWVGPVGLKARKFRVTEHDFAVAMVILRHFKANPNNDGSLPCRRVAELWTALFDDEDVQRPWNHHRWKAIRDFLAARGHIDWSDHRYDYGTVKNDGQGRNKGIACKWSITDEYDWTLEKVASLSALSRGEASFVDTRIRSLIPTQGNGENLRPTPFPLRVELEQKFWFRAYDACEHLCAA